MLTSQRDIMSLAVDILSLDGDGRKKLHALEDKMFSVFFGAYDTVLG